MKSKNGENKLRRYILEPWLPVGGGDWLEEDMRKIPGAIEMFHVLTGELLTSLELFGNRS